MSGYCTDRAWSDRFIPSLRRLIGPHLLEPSTFAQDAQQAADLVILHARDLRIACRVRRAGFAERYPNQFTLRSERTNGTPTEFRKILEGWGDWLFYGHAVSDESIAIDPWWLIDLRAFRFHWSAEGHRDRKQLRHGEVTNVDQQTRFRWFDIASFGPQPPLLIASSTDIWREIGAGQAA